jgi:hypothetical protein
MKHIINLYAGIAILASGTAQANHCELEAAIALEAIYGATVAESEILEAAQALIDRGLTVCANEEQMALEQMEPVATDPDNVSLGQSMLINASQLVSGL